MTDDRNTLGYKAVIALPSAFWCVAGVLFLLGPVDVGFLSDDYDLIHQAAQTSWFGALEVHHWSPVLTSMFKATHAGVVGRGTWIAITYLAHCTNIAMVWSLLYHRLRVSLIEACTVTLLFTMCSAGFEVLAWSCTLGYVLTMTVLLMGFLLLLPLDHDFNKWTPVCLAALQIVALLIWDWGILFSPLMALCFAFSSTNLRDTSSTLGKGLSLLWPCFACWLIVLAVKASLGLSLGYPVSLSPIRSTYFLLTAPLRCIYPNGLTPFYKSPLGLSVSLCLLLILVFTSRKNRTICVATAMFFVCQVPYILFGAPASRYFYLATPFFYTSLVLSASCLLGSKLRLAVVFALVVMNAVWAIEHATLWKGAYREARQIKTAIEAEMQHLPGPSVVVNLPDRYGPEDMMWKPYVWRRGLSAALNEEIIRVNTTGVPFIWDASGIPVMGRSDIRKKYPDHKLIEVTYAKPHDWRHFAVHDLTETLNGDPNHNRGEQTH